MACVWRGGVAGWCGQGLCKAYVACAWGYYVSGVFGLFVGPFCVRCAWRGVVAGVYVNFDLCVGQLCFRWVFVARMFHESMAVVCGRFIRRCRWQVYSEVVCVLCMASVCVGCVCWGWVAIVCVEGV